MYKLPFTIIVMILAFSSCEKNEIQETLKDTLSKNTLNNKLVLVEIQINNDHEPIHHGAAEIYGILVSFPYYINSGTPYFQFIEMTYLDHQKITYLRNDILHHWNGNEKHVGFVIMETDSNTPAYFDPNFDFRDLYEAGEFNLIDEKKALKILTQRLANTLKIKDDYVDQFYYLPKHETTFEYIGKEKNARVKFANPIGILK